MAAECPEIIVYLRGAWRVQVIAKALRIAPRLGFLLARTGLFDPRFRVAGGKWERVRLTEQFRLKDPA